MKSLKVALFLTYNTLKNGNKGISILTIMMLVLVFLNLSTVPSLMHGAINTFTTSFIDAELGDLSVKPSQGESLITDVDTLTKELAQFDGVTAVTTKNILNAEINYNGAIINAQIVGVDPVTNKQVFGLDEHLIEGSFIEANDTDSILMGVQIAGVEDITLELYSTSFKTLHAGDVVDITMNGTTKPYTVKGIYRMNFIFTDSTIFMPLNEFLTYAPQLRNTARSINLKVDNLDNVDAIVAKIQAAYPQYLVEGWEAQAGMIKTTAATLDIMSNILTGVALIVAAITILIVTYVDLVNKRKQIGIQRAIGISSRAILFSYVLRATMYAIVGLALGVVVFIYVVIPLEHANPLRFPAGYVYLEQDNGYLLLTATGLIAVTVISATVPTLKTLRIKILDAIWS